MFAGPHHAPLVRATSRRTRTHYDEGVFRKPLMRRELQVARLEPGASVVESSRIDLPSGHSAALTADSDTSDSRRLRDWRTSARLQDDHPRYLVCRVYGL